MDYSNIGLNAQLNSVDSLSAKKDDFVSGNEFDATMDYGVITKRRLGTAIIGNAQLGTAIIGTANIGTLSFNEISGGTATLGGTLNGNGVLTVKDSGGTSRVLLDSSGITVTGGSITVVNDGGGTILDSKGIVGTTSFIFGGTVDTSLRQNFGTQYVNHDIANTSLSFILSRTNNVLLSSVVEAQFGSMSTGNASGNIPMNINGTNETFPMTMTDTRMYDGASAWTTSRRLTMAYQKVHQFSSGTHTVKLQENYSYSAGTPTFDIYKTSVNYLILGV